MPLAEADLSPTEKRLWVAMADGKALDLADGDSEDGSAVLGATWGDDRQVRAQFIEQLMVGLGPRPTEHPRRLQLIGARVTGRLDFEGATLPCLLWLERCVIDEAPVLEQASVVLVYMSGSVLPGLRAHQLRTGASMYLEDARSEGTVDLSGARIGGNLLCSGLTITPGPDRAALDADMLVVEQNAELDSVTAHGTVGLNNATISGHLTLVGSNITKPGGVALAAERLTVSGDMFCRAGFSAMGTVDLAGARITGGLDLSDAHLSNAPRDGDQDDPNSGVALRGEMLFVEQAFHGKNLVATGEVNLMDARISGSLNLENAALSNPAGYALNAERLTVEGDAFMGSSFRADGATDLTSATIKGSLELSGAILHNPPPLEPADRAGEGAALLAALLTVDQRLGAEEVQATGMVDLTSAKVSRGIYLRGARLQNPGGFALNAERLTIEGDAYLDDNFSAEGVVNVTAATIRGTLGLSGATLSVPLADRDPDDEHSAVLMAQFVTVDQGLAAQHLSVTGGVDVMDASFSGGVDLQGATVRNPGGYAINAERLMVEGDAFLRDGFAADGAMNLTSATVTGSLDLSGAALSNLGVDTSEPRQNGESGIALVGQMLTVKKTLVGTALRARGSLDLFGAAVGHNLDLHGAVLAAADVDEVALDLEDATICGTLDLTLAAGPGGGIDLSRAEVGCLVDDPAVWPPWLELDGFTYTILEGDDAESWRVRLAWLRRHRLPYSPQIYNQLASVYRAAGHEDAARRILSAKQTERRRYDGHRPLLGRARWLWSQILRTTVGYGYFPWRILYWFGAMLVVGSVVFNRLHPGSFSPTSTGPDQPRFHATLYTLDLLLPVADLRHRDEWIPEGPTVWWSAAFTLMGWLLATVLVGGLAGVFRSD
jgi:hypothetical protein